MRLHFGTTHDVDDTSAFHRVKTHENGMMLYKSHQAGWFLKTRVTDWFVLGCFGGFVTGMSSFLFLPLMVSLMSMPRKLAGVRYFTFHAELLPETQ